MIDTRLAPYGALLLRVSMGVLFLLHGLYLKVFVFGMAGAGKYFASLGLPDWFAWVVVLYETIGGLALILGDLHPVGRYLSRRSPAVCRLYRPWRQRMDVQRKRRRL